MAAAESINCVNREKFYEELDKLKQSKRRNTSQTTLFIEDQFYENAKDYLKHQVNEVNAEGHSNSTLQLQPAQIKIIQRKKWLLVDDKVLTPERKTVVPKCKLFDTLLLAHKRTAHRGRQITSKWINENYSEVNIRVVNLFVGLCPIKEQKKTITSHVKVVTKPMQSPSFLSLIEIDLMDFRKCPCSCPNAHLWSMNIIDHHTKFVTVLPLHHKTAEEVYSNLQNYCFTYGFPKKIITDNGTEFRNQRIEQFCKENQIKIAHGSPRTPQTQGLTERSNRSWKEDMRSLIVNAADKKIKRWCSYTREASYTRNISYHRAIKMTPYEAVFQIKPHREIVETQCAQEDDLNSNDDRSSNYEMDAENITTETSLTKAEVGNELEMPIKRQKIIENQGKYNKAMIAQTERRQRKKMPKYKINDMVAVKIDKVDKKTPFSSNMLLGKILQIEETGCVKIVTEYGKVNTLISQTRLTPCTATNVHLDYENEISFTQACQKASQLN